MKTVFFAILAIFPLLASASILARAPQQNGACSNRCYNEYTLKAKQVTPKRYKYFTFDSTNIKNKGQVCSKLNDACLGKASSTLIMYYGCEYTEDFTAVKAFCTQVQDKGETQDIIDTLVPQFAVTIAKKSDGKCNEFQKGYCIRAGDGAKKIG